MSYEDAVKAVQITSINQAVDQANILMAAGYGRSTIRGEMIDISNHIRQIVEKMNGMAWVVRWEGIVEPMSHLNVPADWRSTRGGTVRNWPSHPEKTIITVEGAHYTVIVNRIWRKEINDVAFAIYAIIPA